MVDPLLVTTVAPKVAVVVVIPDFVGVSTIGVDEAAM